MKKLALKKNHLHFESRQLLHEVETLPGCHSETCARMAAVFLRGRAQAGRWEGRVL